MKRMRILSIFMVLFTLMGVVSCQTEPVDPLLLIDEPENPTPEPASFQVQFGDRTFVADRTVATLGTGEIVITGYAGTAGENVTIRIPATTTGTYTVTNITYDPGANPNFYTNINPANAPTGSVTIQSIDTVRRTISGIFNFTGYYSLPAENLPSIAFTNGVFTNIAYTAPGVNPGPGTALFSVNIDGTPFVAETTQAVIGGGLTTIVGSRGANGESVYISVDAIVPGTYTEALLGYTTDADTEEGYSNLLNTTGNLVITEVDVVNHTISGTFSFTGDYSDVTAALPSKVFTNGVFTDIPYTDEVSDPDVFNATVDGTAIEYGGSDLIVVTTTVNENETVSLNAINANHRIDLFLNGNISTGTYVFLNSVNSTPRVVYTDRTTNTTYNNITGGSLVITSTADGRIVGTFNFEVKNDAGVVIHTVTSGSFDIEP
jgi:hypothetical protein